MHMDVLNKGKIYPQRFCPFCGAAAETKNETDDTGAIWHYVECVSCGVRTKRYRYLADAVMHWSDQIYDTKQKHGNWIYKEDLDGRCIICSECNQHYAILQEEFCSNRFCPDCSARLVQTERIGNRMPSIDDQIEIARRINSQKKHEAWKKKVNLYRQREQSEEALRKMMAEERKEN